MVNPPAAAPIAVSVALADAQATMRLGAALAARLNPGDVLCLQGGLGAGKTTLARGLIEAWTEQEGVEAPSPTYTLVQTYDGSNGPLWHFDLYRLNTADDVLDLGFEDALAQALLVIEWPQILGALTPPDRIEVDLEFSGAGRGARIMGFGRLRSIPLELPHEF